MIRPRRNRKSQSIRKLVKETQVTVNDLMMPLFLLENEIAKEEIHSLPGQFRLGIQHLLAEIKECVALGIHSFILFPVVPESYKTSHGEYGLQENNFYLAAATAIKNQFPEITLASDVALDPYSSDGHDGVFIDGKIDNDITLPILGQMAVVQAAAGFDLIGPSDMMDGRVGVIRDYLDRDGFTDTSILSYTAKYASAMYGPFRDALDSAPKHGDKKTYQMNPANRREALIEAELDELEGADILMVKPAIHYLDIIRDLREQTQLPIAAYHVSGECAMLESAIQAGWMDRRAGIEETLTSIKRAGADIILSYYAKAFAEFNN